MEVPKILNLGSGKSFNPEYLNVDIDSQWNPDLVADISSKKLFGSPIWQNTRRFGHVSFERGYFSKIICHDVLEHVEDLVQTMTNARDLLGEGGVMDILVPYDLSYGAWQDPTHRRAFNERSWLYYTDWFWYLNWTDYRFYTESLLFNYSEKGQRLVDKSFQDNAGMLNLNTMETILATPRCVDSMHVRLKKIALSKQDKEAYTLHHKAA